MGLNRTRRRRDVSEAVVASVEPARAPAVVRRTASRPGSGLAKWQRTDRWFWLRNTELSGHKELVVPLGETFEQGPHLMTRYRTQDGAIRSCSVEFFEANTELAAGLRAVR